MTYSILDKQERKEKWQMPISTSQYVLVWVISSLCLALVFLSLSYKPYEAILLYALMNGSFFACLFIPPSLRKWVRLGGEIFSFFLFASYIYQGVRDFENLYLYIGRLVPWLLIVFLLRLFTLQDVLFFLSFPVAVSLFTGGLSIYDFTGILFVALGLASLLLVIFTETAIFAQPRDSRRKMEGRRAGSIFFRLGLNLFLWALLLSSLLFLALEKLPRRMPPLSLATPSSRGSAIGKLVALNFSDDLPPSVIHYSGFSPFLQLSSPEAFHLSTEPALRVKAPFAGYYRGLVFTSYTGRGWEIPSHTPLRPHSVDLNRGYIPLLEEDELPKYAYEKVQTVFTTLKPHPNVLFALWEPGVVSLPMSLHRQFGSTAFTDENFSLRTSFVLNEGYSYSVLSYVLKPDMAKLKSYRPESLSSEDALRLRQNLELPPLPERISALAHQITDDFGSSYEKMEAIRRFLNSPRFQYQLEIPRIPEDRDAVDYFLFESRVGYCEFYASAMAVLLRSVGIPARVVGGYMGGEYDFLEGAFVIRDKDAHAWVEAYIPNYTWIPIDPTPEVLLNPAAPDSDALEGLTRDVNPLSPGNYFQDRLAFLAAALSYYLSTMLTPLRSWFHRFQFPLILALLLPLFFPYAYHQMFSFFSFRAGPFPPTPSVGQRLFSLLRRLEKKAGVPRSPSATYREYLVSLVPLFPSREREIHALLTCIEKYQYAGEPPSPETLASLQASIPHLPKGVDRNKKGATMIMRQKRRGRKKRG